jgi:hypothetical protein
MGYERSTHSGVPYIAHHELGSTSGATQQSHWDRTLLHLTTSRCRSSSGLRSLLFAEVVVRPQRGFQLLRNGVCILRTVYVQYKQPIKLIHICSHKSYTIYFNPNIYISKHVPRFQDSNTLPSLRLRIVRRILTNIPFRILTMISHKTHTLRRIILHHSLASYSL